MMSTPSANTPPDSVPPQHQDHQPGSQQEMIPEPEVIKASHRGSLKLGGKVALISGGDSGIGRSIAVLFAREGADVAIIYLEEQSDADETQRLVEQEGQRCLMLTGDLEDENTAKQAVEKTLARFGRINILINNAAVQYEQKDLLDIDSAQLEKTFRTNLFSIFYLTKAVLPHLQAGDSIINSTSITSYRGHDSLIDYASTKGAITTFTRSLSTNLMKQKRGIRVNGVAPGPIWTPLIPSSFDAEKVATFGQGTPMGRMGQPSEVAPAYLFLASDDASYITGQIIHVNGGEIVSG
jgi:NAD(P)-dependent dehydrogenase (short-subunit alcohol dehydrogenase family)